ncbi:hypothetical protein COY32_04690 [candidate division WWE3 bacterium CG_4_10_14_0_2_um_filter_41_14]|uniref:Uncharacterized protein n=1 Tax=candidate division WWE3 bacterium CG_4_10_14_0_2_um_filter_41_14 TaxID=1975072 RepID=A0A2M7THR6_UNCKA|nr:MAG: hypothetical protein COY32_04690 [candidate division WWE3 bacterium CG_4_10_14_0_2_um_filter_41_14]
MPCVFFKNVPTGFVFDPNLIRQLHQTISVLADGANVELHVENTHYTMLTPAGTMVPATNVHAVVEWHERPQHIATAVAIAIHYFLTAHGIGNGSDITIRDYPSGSFYFDGKVVESGPPVAA